MSLTPAVARAGGLALGALADAAFGDPRRGHPVAAFGRLVLVLERRLHADAVAPGGVLVALSLAGPVAGGWAVERAARRRPLLRLALTAASTWAVLGGTSLAREGAAMAGFLEDGDLPAARQRLTHLCARDPSELDEAGLARATVESLAENTSDAVVAPLLWGAVAGVPGLLGYRAVNTLDAMVGYTSPRYLRFGRVAARLDDAANLVPARVTACSRCWPRRRSGARPATRGGCFAATGEASEPERGPAGGGGSGSIGRAPRRDQRVRRPCRATSGPGGGGEGPPGRRRPTGVRLGRLVGSGESRSPWASPRHRARGGGGESGRDRSGRRATRSRPRDRPSGRRRRDPRGQGPAGPADQAPRRARRRSRTSRSGWPGIAGDARRRSRSRPPSRSSRPTTACTPRG